MRDSALKPVAHGHHDRVEDHRVGNELMRDSALKLLIILSTAGRPPTSWK